jgi:hypothetical protein
MSRVPPTTSESGKNASGQEAFGTKLPEMLVVESPVALAVDVTSVAVRARTTAASEADRPGLVRLPPPEVSVVTATPLVHRRRQAHRGSWRRA